MTRDGGPDTLVDTRGEFEMLTCRLACGVAMAIAYSICDTNGPSYDVLIDTPLHTHVYYTPLGNRFIRECVLIRYFQLFVAPYSPSVSGDAVIRYFHLLR
jgi:hypothetical protein